MPYVRFPTIAQDRIVFVCEDDLWETSAQGGPARRLTRLGAAPAQPLLSPDGREVAFIGREEGGADLYALGVAGGALRRLTHLGDVSAVAAFDRSGRVVVASAARSPFGARRLLYAVDLAGGEPTPLPFGPASGLAYGPDGRIAIERGSGREPAHWKRYRGGRMGRLWLRAAPRGAFRPLLGIEGNLQSPMWLGDRLYFLSDHEGYGNLYSCAADGGDLRRHSAHGPAYARNARTDGARIVYHSAGDVFLYDPAQPMPRAVDVELVGGGRGPARRLVDARAYVTEYDPHPDGRSLLLVSRGRLFSMGTWEGAAVQLGQAQGVRYRLAAHLPDGEHVAAVSDAGGDEALEVHATDGQSSPRRLREADVGHALVLSVRPTGTTVAVTNHRLELLLVDVGSGASRIVDRARFGRIDDLAWSPDGRYLAYSYPESRQTRALRLFDLDGGKAHSLTRPVLSDFAPTFDPAGRYLYFLSKRVFDPVGDNLEFGFSFPRGVRPYALVLERDGDDPFRAVPRPVAGGRSPVSEGKPGTDAGGDPVRDAAERSGGPIRIDLDGIQDRVLAFPVAEARYTQIAALDGGRLLYLEEPVEARRPAREGNGRGRGILRLFDLSERKADVLAERVDAFRLSLDHKAMVYRSGRRLRVVQAGVKVDEGRGEEAGGRRGGWVDLDRPRVEVDLGAEWRQMVRDAWRQMRDFFWTADMGGVDWEAVYERYAALAARVATRAELSDLLWEMQGEIGTSHAYEMSEPPDGERRTLGSLGAEYAWDPGAGGYRITRLIQGDTWSEDEDSPLRRPGVGAVPGDVLLKVNGRPLDPVRTPGAALVDLAGEEVALTLAAAGGTRTVTARALGGDGRARYREWVDRNRAYVHETSGGRIGYVHVPDMMPQGYAEFHRGYLAESERDALLLDVRYNRGGAVSWLLMDKLRRKVVSYRVSRGGEAQAFPVGSVRGPMACLTNAFAGSDGDAVCQEFKLYGLGPVIGTRTWGGTIAISGERRLVDGTAVTQPEMRRWFAAAGWRVENRGVEPDIEVEERPEDAARRRDRQLERAVAELLRRLAESPPAPPPDPAGAPPTAPPPLPPPELG